MDQASTVEHYTFGDETTSDVRVHLKNEDKRTEWFSCHSSIISRKSKYFADQLSRDNLECTKCIEVTCPSEEYDHYVRLFRLLYLPEVSVLDSLDCVKSAIGILRASLSLQCESVTKNCIRYLEAVPWDEKEEEQILKIASILGPEAEPLLARLQPPSKNAVKDVFISAIRFATTTESPFPPFLDELKTSAQEQVEYMLLEDEDTPLVIMDEDVGSEMRAGLTKLLSTLKVGLDLLSSEFAECPEVAERRVIHSLLDLDWITNILPKMEIMKDFVSSWSEMSDHVLSVVQDEKYNSGLWAVKVKLIELTGKALDAVGYGSVILATPCRVLLLKTWLPFIRKIKPLLDLKREEDETFEYKMDSDLCQNIEGAIVSMILALPSSDQADILGDWMNRIEDLRYPDLTEAFEVWCYRTKTAKRRLVTGFNGVGNCHVSF